MNFQRSLALARDRPDDEAALSDLAEQAIAEGEEEIALPWLQAAAEGSSSALLWQWTALLQRALDENESAAASFGKAATLAPADKSIAHGRARVALEAGLPAVPLFQQAIRMSPTDGDVMLGYAAALFAEGRAHSAEVTMDQALAGSPLWIEGHMKLAQLRSRMGKKQQATSSVERALELHPREEQLWIALFRLLLQSQRFDALDDAVGRARPHLPNGGTLLCYEAIAAVERGDAFRADRLFAAMSEGLRSSLQVYWIRHLLRNGRVDQACTAVDSALATDLAPNVWPYAALAWRLAGDPRWRWLEGDGDRFVSVVDLAPVLLDMKALEQALRRLHAENGEFLDQSVRGGSQTDGPLFAKADPSIRALRAAIVPAIERYVRDLPPRDAGHPLLGPRRDRRIRFSGSWSVLLRGAGFHADHVHPQGWISSALYIRVPDHSAGEPKKAGWLTIGESPAELNLNMSALREVEPKPGRLVLFPSYMWHGTRPFAAGERLSVAFDVQHPA